MMGHDPPWAGHECAATLRQARNSSADWVAGVAAIASLTTCCSLAAASGVAAW